MPDNQVRIEIGHTNSKLGVPVNHRSKIISLLAVLLWTFGAPGQGSQMLFQQATTAYQNQQFSEASELYLNILSRGFESKEVYYNLGNCYYRLNDIGKSILYYEKALRLDPHDNDVRYNLELANLRVIDRIELPPRFILFEWWDTLKVYYSVSQLTRLVSIFFATTLGLVILWLFIKKDRLRSWIISAALLTGILVIFWTYVLITRVTEQSKHREAIVQVPLVTVMSAPDENSTEVFVLHEGVKIRLEESRTDWVMISLPDGKSGWVKNENLGII